ncbi:uncharacterized protein LOC118196063 [Stegodyphus dumicola]|uniref:uncharacterized protein LOC118196063 n=1 Tax=Stegodyphus dumicola TaxID=202533 RepID=UPI0015AB029D|nr:uncharacterized protein LOC118196063 [Stegodyphus dumicola]XP_035223333.1 uncharacterized protein LOC118196063 [Stegodyphus dumicola]XP_035223334.1 uncharacterized protein LOC118196063 [Stegodyphus dumicola]
MGRKKSKRGRHRSQPYPAVFQVLQNGHQSRCNEAVIENNLPGSSYCKSTGELRLKISKCTVQCTDIAKSGFCIQNEYKSTEEGKRSTDVGTSDVCLHNGCKSAGECKQSSNPLKLKIPKSIIQPNEIKVRGLRRTSRRIIVRVRKDFYSDMSTKKRKKKCSSETKNVRDSSLKNEAVEASALNEKEKPRRRGRPKKVSSDLQPNQHEKKPSSSGT